MSQQSCLGSAQQLMILLAGLQAQLPADWPEMLPKLQVLKLSDWQLGSIPSSCTSEAAACWLRTCSAEPCCRV